MQRANISTETPLNIPRIVVRMCPLMIMFILSLFGNSLVVISFGLNEVSTRPRQQLDVFILNLAVLGLMECLITQPISCGYSLEEEWIFGGFMVNLVSAFIQLKNIGVLLTITAIAIGRYGTIAQGSNEATSNVHYANYAVLYSWMHSCIFSLPLLVQSKLIEINSRPFIERCLAGLTENTTFSFTITLTVACYCGPLVITSIFLLLTFRKIEEEKYRIGKFIDSKIFQVLASKTAEETEKYRFLALLFTTYLFFVCPYLFMDISCQLGFGFAFLPSTTNSTTSHHQIKVYYQTILMWLMLLFSSTFPLLTFYFFSERRQNINQTFKRTFVSNRSNIRSPVPRRAVHRHHIEQINRRRRQQKRRPERKCSAKKKFGNRSTEIYESATSKNITSSSTDTTNNKNSGFSTTSFTKKEGMKIPVLIPTNEGLQVDTYERTILSNKAVNKTRNISKKSTDQSTRPQTAIELNRSASRSTCQFQIFSNSTFIQSKLSDEDAGYIGSDLDDSNLNLSGNNMTLMLPFHGQISTRNSFEPSVEEPSTSSQHQIIHSLDVSKEHEEIMRSNSTESSKEEKLFVDLDKKKLKTDTFSSFFFSTPRFNKITTSSENESKFRRVSAWSADLSVPPQDKPTDKPATSNQLPSPP